LVQTVLQPPRPGKLLRLACDVWLGPLGVSIEIEIGIVAETLPSCSNFDSDTDFDLNDPYASLRHRP